MNSEATKICVCNIISYLVSIRKSFLACLYTASADDIDVGSNAQIVMKLQVPLSVTSWAGSKNSVIREEGSSKIYSKLFNLHTIYSLGVQFLEHMKAKC